VTKTNRSVAIVALTVRPPMRDNISHRFQRRDRRRTPVAMENTGYAAHCELLYLFEMRR
jgi:hypothetical protein